MKTLILSFVGIALSMPLSVQAEAMTNRSVVEHYLKQGRSEAKLGHTPAAEVSYRRAVTIDPTDAMAHYLLANLLARTDRHMEAISEYKLTLRIDPSSQIAGFSREALGAYKQTAFAEAASSWVDAPQNVQANPYAQMAPAASFTNRASIPYPVNPALAQLPPGQYVIPPQIGPNGLPMTAQQITLPPQAAQYPLPVGYPGFTPAPQLSPNVATAMGEIDRQAQFEKERDALFASRLGRSAVRGGSWKANDIKQNTESDIAAMYASNPNLGGRSRSGRSSNGSDLDRIAQQMRDEADQRGKLEQSLAADRASEHDAWARDRQRDIDQVAGNLKEQLTQKPSDYGFDLKAEGTGLYVRNYKSSKPKKVLPQPRFSVLRLTEPGVQDDN